MGVGRVAETTAGEGRINHWTNKQYCDIFGHMIGALCLNNNKQRNPPASAGFFMPDANPTN